VRNEPANIFPQQLLQAVNRREFLRRGTFSLGSIALATLLRDGNSSRAGVSPNAQSARLPDFAARAKHVIYLHMVGGPSQLDLFDPKPVLQKFHGQPCPAALLEGQRFAFLTKSPKLLGTRYQFAPRGEAGHQISELLPHLARVADDIAVAHSLHTEEFNHGPAQVFMATGFGRQGRPSMGSWISYGLGSEGRDLPSFVVLVTGLTPGGGTSLWGQGFLPSVYQGVQFRTAGDPVLFVSNPRGIDAGTRGRIVGDIRRLNEIQLQESGNPEIATRIASYEMAYRMQSRVPELMDIRGEPGHIHEMYGTRPGQASFANNCLLARRLVERGVRFVQLYDDGWDHHGNLAEVLPKKCAEVDQPIAALLKDLKLRGLLDETLVVFGGEFGRTPMLQGEADERAGRDHHKEAFTFWMAGGGVKAGVSVGQTDDLGYHVVADGMHVNDLHATVLHLLGLDHLALTYRFQGRDYRLTDVGGEVVEKLLA
jgi:hypothetical protein